MACPTCGDEIKSLPSVPHSQHECIAALRARAERAEEALRAIEALHVESNRRVGRPEERSRTLGIVRRALSGAPQEAPKPLWCRSCLTYHAENAHTGPQEG